MWIFVMDVCKMFNLLECKGLQHTAEDLPTKEVRYRYRGFYPAAIDDDDDQEDNDSERTVD